MANIFMSSLRAVAVKYATTEGFEGLVKVADYEIDPNDAALKIIDTDDEPNWLDKLGDWFKGVVSNPLGWLSNFNPITILVLLALR